jgi:tungstate transport system substrate-binding protein
VVSRTAIAVLLGTLLWTVGFSAGSASGDSRFITLASTTSTENSGLFEFILPRFTAKTGIVVRVVAVGTGQALRIARNGDADVVLVHDRSSEEAFVKNGYGVERRDVMYNDFVLLGPRSDPAGIRGGADVGGAMARIFSSRSPFLSRGDDSGTHKAEMRLWKRAGVDPRPHSGTWYRESGAGMGATLNTAAGMNAYTLADRGTWRAFGNRGELVVLVEGQPPLHNPYGVMLVDPRRHPHVKAADGQAFVHWLVSPEGQASIAAFEIDGEKLFFPSASSEGPATSDP